MQAVWAGSSFIGVAAEVEELRQPTPLTLSVQEVIGEVVGERTKTATSERLYSHTVPAEWSTLSVTPRPTLHSVLSATDERCDSDRSCSVRQSHSVVEC